MSKGFKPLGATIEALYKGLGLRDEFILGVLKRRWPELVGEDLVRNSEPQSINDNELVIKVSSPAWAEEMKCYLDEILKRLRPYNIERVRFRIGRINPGILSVAPEDPEKLCSERNEKVKEFVRASVSCIKDEILRTSVERAMMRSLSSLQKVEK